MARLMAYKVEKIVPYGSAEKKGAQVEHMFDSIAGNYDKLNHTLSMGIDKSWRKKSLLTLKEINPENILDIATGTGDLAIQAYQLIKPGHILAVDLSEGMMKIGRKKVAKAGLEDRITFKKQDCLNLEIPDNSFDAAMVGFGVRNFENLDKGLSEILRVLKPNGRLMILELTSPTRFPMKQAYLFYSKWIIPTIGKLISKDNTAYRYLPESIKAFPQGEKMVGILAKNGFKNSRCKTYTFGICTMYAGEK